MYKLYREEFLALNSGVPNVHIIQNYNVNVSCGLDFSQ